MSWPRRTNGFFVAWGRPEPGDSQARDLVSVNRKVWIRNEGVSLFLLIAVETPITGRPPPRTDPYVRLARIRLLPRVFDGEANVWPRV